MEAVITAKSIGSFVCGHCEGCGFNVYICAFCECVYNTTCFHFCVSPYHTEILYRNDLDEGFSEEITLLHDCYTRINIDERAANFSL